MCWIFSVDIEYIPKVQEIWGFPMYPGGHLHDAMWLATLHNAVGVQSHGFWQCSFLQANVDGHSESVVHSGLLHSVNGSPIYAGGQ